jgi:hypothetical protein
MAWITAQLNRRVLTPIVELTLGDILLVVVIVKVLT